MSKRNWLSPLAIPEGESGTHRIKHVIAKAGEPVQLSTMRNRLLGGQSGPLHQTYNRDTLWHQLSYEGGVWMTDYPVEQRQMLESLKGFRGTVLVGGLGLGLAATFLADRAGVKQITVVEKSRDVIDLVERYTLSTLPSLGPGPKKVAVVNADLFEFLKEYQGPKFDRAFYDIWQGDGESTFFRTVLPLHRLSAGKVKMLPRCWNEDVMRGQLMFSLQNRIHVQRLQGQRHLLPETHKAIILEMPRPFWEEIGENEMNWNWSVPYFRWWKDVRPEDPIPSVRAYASIYGLPGWEPLWEAWMRCRRGK